MSPGHCAAQVACIDGLSQYSPYKALLRAKNGLDSSRAISRKCQSHRAIVDTFISGEPAGRKRRGMTLEAGALLSFLESGKRNA